MKFCKTYQWRCTLYYIEDQLSINSIFHCSNNNNILNIFDRGYRGNTMFSQENHYCIWINRLLYYFWYSRYYCSPSLPLTNQLNWSLKQRYSRTILVDNSSGTFLTKDKQPTHFLRHCYGESSLATVHRRRKKKVL